MYTKGIWQDRISGSPGQFSATGSVPGNVTLALNDSPSQVGTFVTAARMSNIEQGVYVNTQLTSDAIQGTIQTPTTVAGQITQILHTVSGVTVRTDTFTYTPTLITEVRTLATGETLTLNYSFATNENFTGTVIT